MKGFIFFICVSFLITGVSSADSSRKKAQISLYDTENIYLLRHALAPGTGDPDNFDVNDCDTQRNLSEEGRRQAVRIGKKFLDNLKIPPKIFFQPVVSMQRNSKNIKPRVRNRVAYSQFIF